jgi:hypothetical protein
MISTPSCTVSGTNGASKFMHMSGLAEHLPARRQVPLGQRCGKFSKSARQRTMPMRARSMASGDSDAISLSIISASVSISFVIECSLLRSRGASRARGLFNSLSPLAKRGDGAPAGATNPYVHAFVRRRGAYRRAVAAFSFGFGPRFAEAVVFASRFVISDESRRTFRPRWPCS